MGQMLLTGAGGGASNVLASVPWVAQWKFNNNGNDSNGANNLTNNNSATFTTGKLGGATGATQLVAASSQYWSLANNSTIQTGDIDFTIASWLYFDSNPSVNRWICKNGEYNAYAYAPGGGNYRFGFDVKGGAAVVDANTFGQISTATWYCVIVWHDSVANVIGIEVNGVSDTTSYSGGITANTNDLGVGFSLGVGQGWNGRLDNICFAKSAAGGGGVLTAAQRTAFYNAGVGTETLT